MNENEKLAKQIAAISSLTYETALRALNEGGRPGELALSILAADRKYAENNAKLKESKKRLRELLPA